MPNDTDIITSVLNKDASKSWAERLAVQASAACSPLTFSVSGEPNMPVPFEVTRNGDEHVVIHFFRRPQIARSVGEKIVQRALKAWIGGPGNSMPRTETGALKNVFYRDEEEIRKKMDFKYKILEADSWYVEFPLGLSSILPDTETIRNRLVTELKAAWSIEGRTTT